MKVCIVTLYGNVNFGNRLQNYALQETIKKIGVDCETIISQDKSCIRYIKRIANNILNSKSSLEKKRFLEFKKFERYINCNKKVANWNKSDQRFNYDYYITGSDQVWNPQFNSINRLKFNLLKFAPQNKRISYSASFGQDMINDETKNIFKEELINFKKISVREDSGKKIIKSIDSKLDVKVLIDPTMLLNSDDWTKIMKKPPFIKNKKYILCYFLGKFSSFRKSVIKDIANKNNCEIIDIMDKSSEYYSIGPEHFIYLEKNAFLICTDSFHSSVFAIIFNVPFVIFDRDDSTIKSMNSRIDTLLNRFEIDGRKFNGKEITESNLSHNYSKAYHILEEERKKSIKFLKEAFDIKDCDIYE